MSVKVEIEGFLFFFVGCIPLEEPSGIDLVNEECALLVSHAI